MRNDNGFMYPLSLCMLLLFSLYLAAAVEFGIAERRLNQETQTIAEGEYLMLSAILNAERELAAGALSETGSFVFTGGKADYSTRPIDERVTEMNISLIMENGVQWIGFLHYDNELKRPIKWVEKN